MKKTPTKMIVTPLEKIPQVLIFGKKDILTTSLLRILEKRGCQVFFREKEVLSPKVDYIFQFGELAKTREVLEKAVIDQARYLLVEENLTKETARAEEEIFAFKDKIDCRILRIERASFLNLKETREKILKAMFGGKKPLPSRVSIKKKQRERLFFPWPKFKLVFAFSFLLFTFLFPYLFFGINFFLGAKKLQLFKKNFLKGEFVQAEKDASEAEEFFIEARKIPLPFFEKGKRLSFFGQNCSQTGKALVRTTKIGQRLGQLFLDQEEGKVSERLDQLKVETGDLERRIFLAEAFFKDLDLLKYQDIKTLSLGKKIKEISHLFSSAKESLIFIKKALPLAGEILGLSKDRLYLFLFLNNMELRPGGGFIGSYGLVHLKNGVLKKFETQDVYTADGQLRGHVEPPPAIKKYLDQPHFFLRDSNFYPDFAQNAQKASWFLKKELGIEVDGVIAIDLSFVQKILEELGGVYLPDYKKEIKSENLFLESQTLIQSGFFPGSTQKRDFLGSLARAILAQVKMGRSWLKIAQSLKKGLEEKHVQIYLFDKKGQKMVEELGWGGRIAKIKDSNFNPDYLMIVEANLGVNKANYFVKREVSLETIFEESKIFHQLSISYQNKSPGKTFPGGTYKNYLRVFVPKLAVLESVEVIDKVEVEEEEDKKSWGGLVEIEPKKTVKVSFKYRLDLASVSKTKPFPYELFFQKQPGTEKDTLFLKFKFPKNWKIKKTNFPALGQNGGFNFNTDLSVDRIFLVEWER